MKKSSEYQRVAFYIRVSSDEQAKDGFWMEYQEDSLRKLFEFKKTQEPKWITQEDWWYKDDWYSWWNLNRPAFERLMKAAKNKEFDLVVVWKIDRASRDLKHLLKIFSDLQNNNVSFFSLKENIDFTWPIWKLTFQIFWALAEFEREMISTRTSEWKIASANLGNYTWWQLPYWFMQWKKVDGKKWTKPEIVEEEALVIKRIFNWLTEDKKSPAEIAKEMNRLKVAKWVSAMIKNKNTPWTSEWIKDIIKNKKYNWEYKQNLKDWDKKEQTITNRIEKIIDDATFKYAQMLLNDVKWEKRWWWKNEYLLSRKILDINTGRYFIWVTRNKDSNISYRRKSFRKDNITYPNFEIPWAWLEYSIWQAILLFINDPEQFYKLYKEQNETWLNIEKLNEEKNEFINKIEKKEKYISNIEIDYYEWQIDEDKKNNYKFKAIKEINKFKKEIKIIEDKIENIVKIKISKKMINDISKQYLWKIENLSIKQKQILIDVLIDRITAQKDDKGNIFVDVYFRLDHNSKYSRNIGYEPKNSLDNKKTPQEGWVLTLNGGSSGARTQDLLLKRELLYRLS